MDSLEFSSTEDSPIFRAIFDSAPGGIVVIDAAGIVVKANPAAEKLFGYVAGEMLGEKASMLLTEQFANQLDERMGRDRETGVLGNWWDVEGRRKDGTVMLVEMTIDPIMVDGQRMVMWVIRDNTERKKTEEALRKESDWRMIADMEASRNEQRLLAIFASVTDGIVTIDEFGSIMTFNPAAEKLFGYVAGEVVGSNVSMLMPEIYALNHDKHMEKFNQSGGTDSVIGVTRDLEAQRKDGSVFPIELTVSQTMFDDHRMLIGIIHDITERKAAEKALKRETDWRMIADMEAARNEQRLRAIFDSVADGIVTIDEFGAIMTFNPSAEHIFGYGAGEVVGSNVSMLMPEIFARNHDQHMEDFRRTGGAASVIESTRNLQGQRKDGTLFPLELRITPTRVDEQRIVIGIIRDITERKEAEESLRREVDWRVIAEMEASRNEHRLRAVFESVTDGIITVNALGVILTFNPGAEQLFGYPAGIVVGENVSMLMPEAFAHAHDEYMERYHETAGSPSPIGRSRKLFGLRQDGTTFRMDLTISPKLVDNELMITGIIRDISQQKEIEQALRDSAHQAEEMAERLARSNAELEQFAYVAAHDLQEPLRKVQAFSDRLRNKYDDALDEQGLDYLNRMHQSAERMQLMVQDLLAYSRVMTKVEEFSSVELDTVFRDVVSDLEIRIEETAARVEIGDMPTIDAIPTQMRQLFQNLISNALKFRREKTAPIIKISSELILDETVVVDGQHPEFCQITVEDNGVGFEEKFAEKIFGIFQRLHGRGEFDGTGIGLSVCRKIVERHGGTIAAQSRVDEGSTFTVTLPMQHRSPTDPQM